MVLYQSIALKAKYIRITECLENKFLRKIINCMKKIKGVKEIASQNVSKFVIIHGSPCNFSWNTINFSELNHAICILQVKLIILNTVW